MVKYRAWDKNNKEMARVVGIEFHKYLCKPEYITVIYNDTKELREYADSFVLMECSPFTDKNNNYIYTNDFIKWRVDSDTFEEAQVVKEDGCFKLWTKFYNDNAEYLHEVANNCEIIGNKFED